MQPVTALLLPGMGHGQRVIREHCLLIEVALKETDTTAVFQVYGGNNFHIYPGWRACRYPDADYLALAIPIKFL
jgi:hypothetical protein